MNMNSLLSVALQMTEGGEFICMNMNSLLSVALQMTEGDYQKKH
ncbi:hypothetical protein Psal006b_02329 [Piscirickettsia salmonis]|uniref:Uncharacterized protein n=1 Tax=Piscirickettsia salmonis TaxID=1238 RepID=A0AAC8VGR9_PISSA|nr:hypothetical protein [Piscirickettsia salmonis]ALB22061.1 hypothetical protein KU39_878 [Piscirickettsia salmonis]QGN99324.1 hypothetical protein Psal006b_02329 [Piscirickettsia salmonis]QGO02957.1 hypothetical protein Psal008_02349 [Piscirickettsia salmonis]QGO13616.1 hypothetical protein Psal010b_02325 [Piscirickettsia salmonis]QGO20692.1 hypothetical protein Psal013_02357 [Piscirickettsia salmonis]